MITTGVTGQPWRASITPWGALEPWDDTPPIGWYVAADDRWHRPAEEQSVRQQRVEGTAVSETRVRVPSGDVVQRIFSVADAGGLTIIEVENESTMPVAIAFDRRDVLTERPIVDVPIEGIDLPDGSFVVPLAHTATVRVAVAHGEQRSGPLPAVSSVMQVVRGWTSLTERASRFVLPDGERGSSLAAAVTAERCEIALGSIPRAADDAAGYLLALHELVRMGEAPDHWIPELVDAIEQLAPERSWDADVALEAAQRVLAVADERRGGRDLAKIVAKRTPSARPTSPPDGVRAIAWLETLLAQRSDLLPTGLPVAWLGQSLDVYGIPTDVGSAVSFAIRWHGERPAVLWEQSGPPKPLTASTLAPAWSSDETTGETLWPVPPNAAEMIAPTSDDDVATDRSATSSHQPPPTPPIAPPVVGDDEPGSFT